MNNNINLYNIIIIFHLSLLNNSLLLYIKGGTREKPMRLIEDALDDAFPYVNERKTIEFIDE